MQPDVPEVPDDEAKKRERRRDDRSPSADRPAQPGRTPSPGEKPRSDPGLTQSGGEPRQDPGGPRTTREQPENTDVESE